MVVPTKRKNRPDSLSVKPVQTKKQAKKVVVVTAGKDTTAPSNITKTTAAPVTKKKTAIKVIASVKEEKNQPMVAIKKDESELAVAEAEAPSADENPFQR